MVYKCNKCQKEFIQRTDFKRHLNRKIDCLNIPLEDRVAAKVLNVLKFELNNNNITTNMNIVASEVGTAKQRETLEEQIIRERWENMSISEIRNKMKENKISPLLYKKGKNVGRVHSNKKSTIKHCMKWARDFGNLDEKQEKAKEREIEPTESKEQNTGNKTTQTILKIVDKLHNIMRNNDATYGKNAYNDIIRILFLRFIQPFLNGGLSSLRDPDKYVQIEDFEIEWLSLLDFSNLATGEKQKLTNEGYEAELYKLYDMLSYHPYTKDIFKKKKSFNCKGSTLRECINIVHTELKTLEFSEVDNDVMGIIHEYFVNRYANSKDKEFGQFFTPRELLHNVFKLNKNIFPNFKPISCYEPCMGTAGALIEMYKALKKDNKTILDGKNFHAVELDPDAYTIGMMNLLLTFKPSEKNASIADIKRGSSLLNNINEKYDWIATNPPFSNKVDYNKLVGIANIGNYTAMYGPNDIKEGKAVELKSMYPIISNKNDGFTCFLQHCISKLSLGGVCNIVLPDGRFFSGNGKLQHCRQYLIEKCNLKAIMNIPGGVFTHAGVSTAVLFFQGANGTRENPATTEVQFYKATSIKTGKVRKVTGYEHLGNVPFVEIVKQDYSLKYQTYKVEELPEYENVEWKTLGELCEFKNGNFNSNDMSNKGDIPFYTCSAINPSGVHTNHTFDFERYLLVIGSGGSKRNMTGDNVGLGMCHYVEGKTACRSGIFALIPKQNNANLKYTYYYLNSNRDKTNSYANFTTNLGTITKENIKKIKIPVPSLEVQQQIVDICTKAEENKKMAQKMIQNTKDIIKDYCKKHITIPMHKGEFKCKTLGELCEFKNGKQLDTKNIINGKYPIFGGGIKIIGYHNDYNRTGNEIIVAGTGVNCGYVSRYQGRFWASQCFTIDVKNKNFKDYIYYLCKFKLQKIFKKKKRGSGQPYIRGTQFENLKIPVPPLDVQQQIVDYMDMKYASIKSLENDISQYKQDINNTMKF